MDGCSMDGWMDRWMFNGWIDGWMDMFNGWMDGCSMDGWICANIVEIIFVD